MIKDQKMRMLFLLLPISFFGIGCSEQNDGGSPAGGAQAPVVGERTGQLVYESYCFACHDHGAAGAPVITRPTDWRGRASKGKQKLLVSVQGGLGAMPKKGSCFDCTVEELGLVIDHILNEVSRSAKKID